VAIAQSIFNAGGVETGELSAIPNQEMMDFMTITGLLCPALLQYAPEIVNSAIKVPDGNKAILRCILTHNIDFSNAGMSEYGPLECAIKEDLDLRSIEFLLQRKAPVRQRTVSLVVEAISKIRHKESQSLKPRRSTPKAKQTKLEKIEKIFNLVLQHIPDAWKHGMTKDSPDRCRPRSAARFNFNFDGPRRIKLDLPAIIVAAKEGLLDIAKILLDKVDWSPRIVGVALTVAILNSNYHVVDYVLATEPLPSLEESYWGYSPFGYRDSGSIISPLSAAVKSGKVFLAKRLIKLGARVDRGDESWHGEYTALQLAASLGREEMVDLLLENGADPNARGGGFFEREARLDSFAACHRSGLLEYCAKTSGTWR
jgi:hypothetical protein